MKLLVFAHTPPPHHGQSYMVQLALEGFRGDRRKQKTSGNSDTFGIECYHVNARFSQTVQEIGGFRVRKLLLLAGYCLQAIWIHFRYGVSNFYYVPAPGKPAPLYRDWLVMILCRPFFKNVIFHWHAAGLVEWLEQSAPALTRRISFLLMRRVGLNILLCNYHREQATKLNGLRIRIVNNGIPDPRPEFEKDLLPMRLARFAARKKLSAGTELTSKELQDSGGDPHIIKVLFLGLCCQGKGLFDSLEAIALVNKKLAASHPRLRFRLYVGGEFLNSSEKEAFEARVSKPDLQLPETCLPKTRGKSASSAVEYLGFISGEEKSRAFAQSDCFCFPTHYYAENFPMVLIEAMSFGLPIVTTRWRSVPELFPADYGGLVDVRSPDLLASTMQALVFEQTGEELRRLFVRDFKLQRHLSNLAEALRSVEGPVD